MANTKRSDTGTNESNVDETSSIVDIIDGVKTSNTNDATSRDKSVSTVGYLDTPEGLKPIINPDDIYNYIFVGFSGENKIYRK